MCTICMAITVIAIIFIKAGPILNYDQPYNQEVKGVLDDLEPTFYHKDTTPKIVLQINDNVKHFALDRTKIDIYVNHTLWEYNNVTKIETFTRYEIRTCNSTDF